MTKRLFTLVAAAALTLPVLQGCNDYEMFRLAGLAQEDFSNDAELLFVIDNSTSMLEESADLAVNFDGFIAKLINPTGDGTLDGLSDAVDNYILSVGNRGDGYYNGPTLPVGVTVDASSAFGRVT